MSSGDVIASRAAALGGATDGGAKPAGSERGAVLVVSAVLLVVLLAFAALAVDAATAWSNRRLAQNAADLSSLAAAQAIPHSFDDREGVPLELRVGHATATVGEEFVGRNAATATGDVAPPVGDAGTCTGVVRPCYTDVTVEVTIGSANSFAPAIGGPDELTVVASATAHIEIDEPALKLLPLAVNSVSERAFRCLPTEGICVIPLSLPLPALPPPLPPLPTLELLGSTDIDVIGLRRADSGCVNAVATTSANFLQGADHLVDTDLATVGAAERPELGACEVGHHLTMPNTSTRIPDQRVDALLTQGVQPLLGGSQLWDHLSGGAGWCDGGLYDLVDTLLPSVPGLEDLGFVVKSLAMASCLESGNPTFSFSGNEPQLGWAIDVSGTSAVTYQAYTPVWVHSLLDSGVVSDDPVNPTGFTVFILSEEMVPESLVEHDPGGIDNLTFMLVD